MVLCSASATWAQETADSEDPADSARFRLGVLRFTPGIAISSVGVDNNVFNEADNPKQDTTAGVGPAVNSWLRLGKARLALKNSAQYAYFRTYENQRSWSTSNQAQLEMPLSRIRPFVRGEFINSRERPGFEIDSRARRTDQMFGAGLDVRLSPKTNLVVAGSQSRLGYDRDETFLGESLADALDRHTTMEHVEARIALTPLSTFTIAADAIQDRFDVGSARNADSIRVLPGFEMKPAALISGHVAVGVRNFNARNDTVPDFTGVVAATDVTYTVSASRLQFAWDRDLTFSYQTDEPYYALSDLSVSLTERITQAWEAVFRAGRQTLSYRRLTALPSLEPRKDNGSIYMAGVGYRLGTGVRLGFDVNYSKRDSDQLGFRNFEGLRMGGSLTYGIAQ
jgi:hypothetical protein